MSKTKKIWIGSIFMLVLMGVFSTIVYSPSIIKRVPFAAPEASYQNWEEILSHPQPITVRTYSTGVNRTTLAGIMNLEHEKAQNIADKVIDIPVNAFLVQHQDFGATLIDAGLDQSYVHSPHGTMKGLMVESYLSKDRQEPNTHIAAVLEQEQVQLQGVWLTHLHMDHTAGIVDLPKDIPYVVGKGERYVNFRFIMQGEHLAGIEKLYEFDFDAGIDLSPLGMGVDVYGDGSLWAISSSGHSAGHVIYLVNGIDGQILVAGDACNDAYQFDMGIGPGTYSSDLEGGQEVLEQIIEFKQRYPEVTLVFGHDLETR